MQRIYYRVNKGKNARSKLWKKECKEKKIYNFFRPELRDLLMTVPAFESALGKEVYLKLD